MPTLDTISTLGTKKTPSLDQGSTRLMIDLMIDSLHLQPRAFCTVFSILGAGYKCKEQDNEFCCEFCGEPA